MDGATRIGPYQVLSLLGRGGMGSVYRAVTPQGDHVALKVLSTQMDDDPLARLRFRREFRLLSLLRHPNLVSVFEAGEHEGRPYYTMECIEGQTISDALAACESPLASLLRYAIEICIGLEYIHHAGIVHRDLKPANIMVTHQSSVKLTDFGVAREVAPQTQLSQSGTLIGTVHYMAPEQITMGVADARSDLYSLGVTLYELACGRLPFKEGDVMSMLLDVLNLVPLSPIECEPAIPERLSDLLMTLLQKEPQSRLQSAQEVRAELERMALDLNIAVAVPAAGAVTSRRYQLLAAPLVGREKESEQLLIALEAAQRGKVQVMRLIAENGMGKTRLAHELSGLAGRRGFQVCAPPPTASRDRNFPLFIPLIRRLTEGREIPFLLRPLLSETLGDFSLGDDKFAVFEAVTQVMRDFVVQPTLMVLDGLAGADIDSRELLTYLLKSLLLDKELPLMLLLLEGAASKLPAELASSLRLPPLSEDEVLLVVGGALGATEGCSQWVPRLYRETGGNPGFVLKTLQWLLDERLLWQDGARWSLRDIDTDVMLAPEAEAMLMQRIARLPAEALDILRIMALLGGEAPYRRLEACCRADERAFLDVLDGLLEQRLLQETADARLRFAQLSTARLVLAEVSATRRQSLHGDIASRLEKAEPSAHMLIGENYQQAGLPVRALPHFRRAAELAMAAHAHGRAAEIGENMRVIVQTVDATEHTQGDRCLILDTFIGDGRGLEAVNLAEQWLREESSQLHRASLLRRQGEAHILTGHYAEGFDSLSLALESLGMPTFPRTAVKLQSNRGLLRRNAINLLRGVLGLLEFPMPVGEAEPHLQEAVALLIRIPAVFPFLNSARSLRAVFLLRLLDVVRQSRSVEGAVMVYTALTMLSTEFRIPTRFRIRGVAERFVERTPDSRSTCNLRMVLGVTAFIERDVTAAERWFASALERARHSNLMGMVVLSCFGEAVCALWRGNFQRAVDSSAFGAHRAQMLGKALHAPLVSSHARQPADEAPAYKFNQALVLLLEHNVTAMGPLAETVTEVSGGEAATLRFLHGFALYLNGSPEAALPHFEANLSLDGVPMHLFKSWDIVLAALCSAADPSLTKRAMHLTRATPGIRDLLAAHQACRQGKTAMARPLFDKAAHWFRQHGWLLWETIAREGDAPLSLTRLIGQRLPAG